MSSMNKYGALVGLLGVLLCGAGCTHSRLSQSQLAVSFAFCGYTNDGHSATLELVEDSASIQQYDGPYVEFLSGGEWKVYQSDPGEAAVCAASKHMKG